MSVVGSVTAELLLDTENFRSEITKANELAKNLGASLNTNMNGSAFTKLESSLNTLSETLSKQMQVFERFENALNDTVSEENKLIENNAKLGSSFEEVNSGIRKTKVSISDIKEDFVNFRLLYNGFFATRPTGTWIKDLEKANVETKKFSSTYAQLKDSMSTADYKSAGRFFALIGEGATKSGEQVANFEKNIIKLKEAIQSSRKFTLFEDLMVSSEKATAQIVKNIRALEELSAISKTGGLSNTFMTSSVNPLSASYKSFNTNSLVKDMSALESQIKRTGEAGRWYGSAMDGWNAKQKQVATSTNQMGNSLQQTSNKMNTLHTATTRLEKGLSSLKMMTTALSSMFVWTFGMSLYEATKQTLQSKNEMESYLRQMGMGDAAIKSFNSGLDDTANKFKKLNKYMIGESIASIGMEFDLSTQQMKKSMDVVAMVQNEYVRAGRKESEASLAVKDILQGEFLRLSRETGVGKQDLIDTGLWKGDLKDIEGLMDALRKVGEDRHWDLFASKCNSMNDALNETMNRISEFGARLIDDASPMIVSAFNSIVGTIDSATSFFNNLDITQQATLLTTSFFAFSGILPVISGRLSLLDAVQLGYSNSLVATIFNLDVATAKEYGMATAITTKVTGLNAETVATLGSRKALLLRLLGLNQEVAVEGGLRQALIASALAKNTNTASTTANTGVTLANTGTTTANTGAYTMNTGAKNVDTVSTDANSGATDINTASKELNNLENMNLIKAIAMVVSSREAETIATGTTSQAVWALITSLTVLEAISIGAVIAGVAVAFGSLAASMQESCNQMKAFNELAENGDEVVQKYKDNLTHFQDEEKQLRTALANTSEGTIVYQGLLDKLTEASKNTAQAQKDLENAINGVNNAQNLKNKVDEGKVETLTKTNAKVAESLREYGYEDADIQKLTNSLSQAEAGAKQYYRGFQVYNKQYGHFVDDNERLLQSLQNSNKSYEEGQKYVEDYGESYSDLINHSFIANTSDDWGEVLWNKMLAGIDGIKLNWIEFWADADFADAINSAFGDFGKWSRDLDKWLMEFDIGKAISDWWNNSDWSDIENIIPDFTKWFDDAKKWWGDKWNEFWSFDWLFNGDDTSNNGGSVAKHIDAGELLKNWFNIDSEGIRTWVNNNIVKPFTDVVTAFIQNPLESVGGFTWDALKFIADLFGMGDSVVDFHVWVYENIGLPLKNEVDLFFQDPIAYVGGLMGNMGSFLTGIFSGDVDTYTIISEWVNNNLVTPLSTGIQTGIANIPIVGDILQFLGLLDSEEVNGSATDKGNNIANALGTAVENKIRSIPILGDVLSWLGVIDNANPTANSKGNAVGSNIREGVNAGKQGTAQLVRDEMNEVISAIQGKVQSAWDSACAVGNAIIGGINSVIQHHSPGVPALLIRDEMWEIGQSIINSRDYIYANAQIIGQTITDGIQPTGDVSFDAQALAQYQADSMIAVGMANDTVSSTESAFSSLDANTMTTFGSIGSTINNTMTNIAGTTKTNYNTILTTTKSQLGNMQSETTKNINMIRTSWNGMQTALIQSAENIRSETGAKIHSLQNNMATFWRKVQNPALLLGGAGDKRESRGSRKVRYSGSSPKVAHVLSPRVGYAGSPNPRGASTGTGISDKIQSTVKNNHDREIIEEYLACLLSGKPCYAGGWNFNWNKDIQQALLQWHTHFGQIYDPYLYVGKFENDTFPVRGIPEIAKNYIYDAISRTSYDYYFNSRYGSPLATWNAGAFNCYDGAYLVMALARAFGFSNSTLVHGSWNGTPHVWARIAGLGDIDSTAIQRGYGFTSPKVTGAGSPPKSSNVKGLGDTTNVTNVNISVDLSGANLEDDGIGERIGKRVRDEIIDLFSPNPVTGA